MLRAFQLTSDNDIWFDDSDLVKLALLFRVKAKKNTEKHRRQENERQMGPTPKAV